MDTTNSMRLSINALKEGRKLGVWSLFDKVFFYDLVSSSFIGVFKSQKLGYKL